MSTLPPWRPKSRGAPEFVLHTSVVFGWFDQRFSSQYSERVLNKLISTAAIVPLGWSQEIAEWSREVEVQGLEPWSRIELFLRGLYPLPIRVDRQSYSHAWAGILSHARTYSIQVHSAAYLELALRLNLPLATTDPILSRSAAAAAVPIYNP